MSARVGMSLTVLAAVVGIGLPVASGQRPADAPPGAEAGKTADRPDDVKALASLVLAFTEAYNKGDARAIGELFTEGAEITDDEGETVRGRESIVSVFSATFKDEPKGTIEPLAGNPPIPRPGRREGDGPVSDDPGRRGLARPGSIHGPLRPPRRSMAPGQCPRVPRPILDAPREAPGTGLDGRRLGG